jgi:hypothetical protein
MRFVAADNLCEIAESVPGLVEKPKRMKRPTDRPATRGFARSVCSISRGTWSATSAAFRAEYASCGKVQNPQPETAGLQNGCGRTPTRRPRAESNGSRMRPF